VGIFTYSKMMWKISFIVGNFLSISDETYVLYLGEQEGFLQRDERRLCLSLPQTLPVEQTKIVASRSFRNDAEHFTMGHTVPIIQFMCSQKINCVTFFPIPINSCICELFYISPGSVCLLGCSRIGGPILGI
jgi:hypothetical protein